MMHAKKREAGNRPLGIFTTTGWKNLVFIFKFVEKSGDKRTKK
jgi:hypothetical protein